MDTAAPEMDPRGRMRERDAAEEDETTTTRSAAAETPAVKRRKLEEDVDGESRIVSSPCVEVQLTDSGRIVPSELETSVVGRNSPAGDVCGSPNSEDNEGGASTSCCSCNGFSEKLNERDLKEGNVAETGTSRRYSCSTRSETWVCSEKEEEGSGSMDSGAGEGKAGESCGRSTVTEAELEDFFTVAEKDLRNNVFHCSTKYNFDFVKEEALDGRYEWVKLKP